MTRPAASCTRTAAGNSAVASSRSHASTVIRAAIHSNSACTAGTASVSSGAARPKTSPAWSGLRISSRLSMARIVARARPRDNAIRRENIAATSSRGGVEGHASQCQCRSLCESMDDLKNQPAAGFESGPREANRIARPSPRSLSPVGGEMGKASANPGGKDALGPMLFIDDSDPSERRLMDVLGVTAGRDRP